MHQELRALKEQKSTEQQHMFQSLETGARVRDAQLQEPRGDVLPQGFVFIRCAGVDPALLVDAIIADALEKKELLVAAKCVFSILTLLFHLLITFFVPE